MSRQPRHFEDSLADIIDMERAGEKKPKAVNPFRYNPRVKLGGMTIAMKRKKGGDADCGCYMCSQAFWAPIACLCEIPPFNVCRAMCIR